MIDIKKLYEYIGDLSYKLFPKATSYEHILKMKQEADEVLNDLNNKEEYADCLFALLAASYKAGITIKELLNETLEKAIINEGRKWKEMPDGTHQHVKPKLRNENGKTKNLQREKQRKN